MVLTRRIRPRRIRHRRIPVLLVPVVAAGFALGPPGPALAAGPVSAVAGTARAVAGTPPAVAGPVLAIGHAVAAERLSAAGLTWWSSGDCTDRNNPECTSFEGIRPETVTGVITFRQASGCAVRVTGGTEAGHAAGTYSHWNGYKVDIGGSACIQQYISDTYQYVGYIAGFGHQYRAPSGNLYTREGGGHWDILYYTCGC